MGAHAAETSSRASAIATGAAGRDRRRDRHGALEGTRPRASRPARVHPRVQRRRRHRREPPDGRPESSTGGAGRAPPWPSRLPRRRRPRPSGPASRARRGVTSPDRPVPAARRRSRRAAAAAGSAAPSRAGSRATAHNGAGGGGSLLAGRWWIAGGGRAGRGGIAAAVALTSAAATRPRRARRPRRATPSPRPSSACRPTTSTGNGNATVKLNRGDATVTVDTKGLLDPAVHPMHIHAGGKGKCPPAAAAHRHGPPAISTVDGEPFYGPPVTAMTNKGDTSKQSILVFRRYPARGQHPYTRTFTLPRQDRPDIRKGQGLGDHPRHRLQQQRLYDAVLDRSDLDPHLNGRDDGARRSAVRSSPPRRRQGRRRWRAGLHRVARRSSTPATRHLDLQPASPPPEARAGRGR